MERIVAQIEREAAKACLPFDFNPDYRAFKEEMAAKSAKKAGGAKGRTVSAEHSGRRGKATATAD